MMMMMMSAFMMKSMPVRSTGSPAATYDPTAAQPAQYSRLRPVIHVYVQERSRPRLRARARAGAQRGYLSRLMDYSNPCGFPHHLEAGRRWLAWKGLRREPDCVVVTSGVQNALVVTLCALFRAGDRIAVDAYTFANFIELAKMMGIELVPVAGDADGMRDAALDALCRAVDVRGVYLMPSCANPTTVHMPLERRRRVAAVAERHGLVIVEDDFGGTVERLDLELGRPVTPRFADLAPERTVHVAETTNTLANGLRIAFLAP